jgi:CYTH domain-containing protein
LFWITGSTTQTEIEITKRHVTTKASGRPNKPGVIPASSRSARLTKTASRRSWGVKFILLQSYAKFTRATSPFLDPHIFCENVEMQSPHKYAKIERERRFLLREFPKNVNVLRTRRIADRYIDGTNLRLRKMTDENAPTAYKLTQKISARDAGAQQGLVVTMYLSEAEFRVFEQLPAHTLNKARHSVPPFGIDVFEAELEGLLLAEAEFDSAAAADVLILPAFIFKEVSHDDRFTGGRLVRTFREDIKAALLECGINLR